jgi:cytochrome b pre-mRNA-processing protein 3
LTGFDEALRDIGTGDLSVGKKIRKMGEAFYGRAKAYDEALADDGAG